jgi:hypothetical protein
MLEASAAAISRTTRTVLFVVLFAVGFSGPGEASSSSQSEGAASALSSAAAATEPPMRFQLFEDVGPECGPNCPEWLSAEGQIVRGTADQFAAALRQVGDRKLPLLISSGGGSVDEAIAMGRMLRERGMTIGVARSIPAPCIADKTSCGDQARASVSPLDAVCFSACTLVLAGGEGRIVNPLTKVGVHQLRDRQSTKVVQRVYRETYQIVDGKERQLSRELISEEVVTTTPETETFAAAREKVAAYLREMGVDEEVWALAMATNPSDLFIIGPGDLRRFRLVTSDLSPRFSLVRVGADTRFATSDNDLPKSTAPEINGVWPFSASIGNRHVFLDATFRAAANSHDLIGVFAVRDLITRALVDVGATGLDVTFSPDGPTLHAAERFAAAEIELPISRANFCALKTSGAIVVAISSKTLAGSKLGSAGPSPRRPNVSVEIDPRSMPGATSFLAAVCSQ